MSLHNKAILQALFVTILWSSSWVFIKIGLKDIPPITFAGLRYFLGFIFLLPFVIKKDKRKFQELTKKNWFELIVLGWIMYATTQGAQFLSLAYFPPVLIVLILNLTPAVVAMFSIPLLGESPTKQQVLGILVCLIGACLYFIPHLEQEISLSWLLAIPILGMFANAASSVLGRAINRKEHLHPRVVTVISMGIGSVVLLLYGLTVEQIPVFEIKQVSIIIWLAGVNTAFAFALWNHTLRTLSSVESSVINNTMMIQIAILAVIFLGEKLSSLDILALLIASVGALLVQLRRRQFKTL